MQRMNRQRLAGERHAGFAGGKHRHAKIRQMERLIKSTRKKMQVAKLNKLGVTQATGQPVTYFKSKALQF